MKKKLVNRIIGITVFVLVVSIILSFTLFNFINFNTVQTSLNNSVRANLTLLNYCRNKESLPELLKGNEVTFITIFDHNDQVFYESSPNIVSHKFIEKSDFLDEAKEGKNYKIGRPYNNNATMLMCTVKLDNPYLDPSGPMWVRFSMVVVYNNESFFWSIALCFCIFAFVIMGAMTVMHQSMRIAIAPVSDIEKSLKDITEGRFRKSNVINCGDKDMDSLYNQLGEISDQISTTFLELHNEQAKSKFLLQSISQGIMALSKMGTIMIHNHVLEDIFDYEDLGGVSIDYIIEGDLLESVKKSLENNSYSIGTMHKNKNAYRVECVPVDSDYTVDELGNIVLLVIFTDITQEEETNLIRNEFFANASHELKTPLTAISGYSEIITMGNRDQETIKKCANEIMSNATKMKDLINNMMKLSKLDAKIDMEEETTFDLYEICQIVVNEQKLVAQNKKVTLSLEGVSANIVGRKNMIKVVVENLVSNAIKYNKENGTVTVKIRKDKKYITLEVIDTGIGIPKEHQGRLFERFYKVDEARTRTEESSTGLGLSIVKNIIVMHKAQISVNSKEGCGTTMTVKFTNICEK